MAKYLMRVIVFLLMTIVGIACAGVGMNTNGPSNLPDTDPLNTTYTIEEQALRLINGRFEKQAAPGSATRIRASVFGRPVFGDLDDDADDDAVVVIVYDPGGSGTFYYIAAAISQNGSYKGTSGFLLGDRIAVKDVEIRKGVVFVQYADRRPAEPMSAPPLVDRSIQLILTGGRLSPVRPLIKQEKVRRMDPELDLYHEDGRHANPAGSYLTACVFYSILFKTTPEGLPGILGADRKKLVDLDGNQALFLQKAAFESTAAPCAARDE